MIEEVDKKGVQINVEGLQLRATADEGENVLEIDH